MSERIVQEYGAGSRPLHLGSGRGLLSSSYGKDWGGPPVELHEWGTADANRRAGPSKGQLGVLLILSGRMVVTLRDRTRTYRRHHQPGTIVLLSGDAPPDVVRMEGSVQGLAIAVTDGWHPPHGAIPARPWRDLTTSLQPDRSALSLGLAIRAELEAGAPSGALFSEALSLSLLNLTETRDDRSLNTHALTATQRIRIRDYVEEHLGGVLSIDELAALVGLRRRQFSACFRASFGMSPYRFVVQRRVTRGAILLAHGNSIAEAAMAAGFCNQSHFTAAYRRQFGITPSAGRPQSGPGTSLLK